MLEQRGGTMLEHVSSKLLHLLKILGQKLEVSMEYVKKKCSGQAWPAEKCLCPAL